MIKIKLDKAIETSEEDELGLEDDVKRFLKRYIDSGYKGSILLTGKWGVGKTSYLKNIEKSINDDRKVIWLDFWDRYNTSRFYGTIYSKLHPKRYKLKKIQPLSIVTVVAILTVIINISMKFLGAAFSIAMLIIFMLACIINNILIYFKDNIDVENSYRKSVRKYAKKEKLILILDDFDRIDEENKNKLYSYLSDLNSFNNSLIIVVGEYKKILDNSNDIFTQKILKHIEYMPIKNNSSNIWEKFQFEIFDIISSNNITDADKNILKSVKNIFIKESRTYREYIQLYNYFESVYINKANKQLNPSEVLSLCYIFAFYNDIYEIISHQLISEIALSNKSNKEDEKRDKIDNILNDRNIVVDDEGKEFIFYTFNHFRYNEMKFPSITDERNYELYQIENNDRTEVNSNVIKQYIDSDKENSKNILDNLDYIDFERFFIMYRDRMVTGKAAQESKMYLKEMEKLVYYIFKGNYGEYSINDYPSSSQDVVLFTEISSIVEDNFKINKIKQYETIIENNNDLDDSQKIMLFNFLTLKTEKNDGKVEFIENVFSNLELSNIQNMSFPWYIYHSYTTYYRTLYNPTINKALSEICNLDNVTFFEFIKNKFVINNTAPNNKRYSLSLDDICFNNDFKNELEDKIRSLNPNQKKEIEKYINNNKKRINDILVIS